MLPHIKKHKFVHEFFEMNTFCLDVEVLLTNSICGSRQEQEKIIDFFFEKSDVTLEILTVKEEGVIGQYTINDEPIFLFNTSTQWVLGNTKWYNVI